MLDRRSTIFSTPYFQFEEIRLSFRIYVMNTRTDLLCLPSWHNGKLSWKSHGFFYRFLWEPCNILHTCSQSSRLGLNHGEKRSSGNRIDNRLVLKCRLAHLNADARDESITNAQHLNQMQMRSSRIKCINELNSNAFRSDANVIL